MTEKLKNMKFPEAALGATWDRVPPEFREGLGVYCKTIGQRVRRGEGLILGGNVGAGKSCCLALIALAFFQADDLGSGAWVAYRRAYDLMQSLVDPKPNDNRETVYTVELLLIDDWGTEGQDWRGPAAFNNLVDVRWGNRLATCVTTNLSLAQIAERPELARILDRWRERMDLLRTEAKSQRQPASYHDWEQEPAHVSLSDVLQRLEAEQLEARRDEEQ